MAGSYSHVTNDEGQLISNSDFPRMIENLGDAYETIEEMYGMIWYLTRQIAGEDLLANLAIDTARRNWKRGIQLSPGVEE